MKEKETNITNNVEPSEQIAVDCDAAGCQLPTANYCEMNLFQYPLLFPFQQNLMLSLIVPVIIRDHLLYYYGCTYAYSSIVSFSRFESFLYILYDDLICSVLVVF